MDLAHAAQGGGPHFELMVLGVALVVLSLAIRRDASSRRFLPPLLALGGIVLIFLSVTI